MAKPQHLLGIVALLLLVGCSVFAATSVTAKFSDDDIRSGGSTTLNVDAENDKSTTITGYFVIVPDSPQVTVSTDDRTYTLQPKESTGNKVYTVSATSSSKEQLFEVSVYFKDAATHKVLGQDKVVLTVTK